MLQLVDGLWMQLALPRLQIDSSWCMDVQSYLYYFGVYSRRLTMALSRLDRNCARNGIASAGRSLAYAGDGDDY